MDDLMSASHPKFIKIFGITISPWTLIVAVFLIFTWALAGKFFGLSKNWTFVINFSISVLTLFILWRILRKQKREAKAIRMKIDELRQSIKNAQFGKTGQNGNGSRTGEVKLHREGQRGL